MDLTELVDQHMVRGSSDKTAQKSAEKTQELETVTSGG
jgi:hypothetical protein